MKCSNCSNEMVRSRAGWLCISCGHVEVDPSTPTTTSQIATGKDGHDQMRAAASTDAAATSTTAPTDNSSTPAAPVEPTVEPAKIDEAVAPVADAATTTPVEPPVVDDQIKVISPTIDADAASPTDITVPTAADLSAVEKALAEVAPPVESASKDPEPKAEKAREEDANTTIDKPADDKVEQDAVLDQPKADDVKIEDKPVPDAIKPTITDTTTDEKPDTAEDAPAKEAEEPKRTPGVVAHDLHVRHRKLRSHAKVKLDVDADDAEKDKDVEKPDIDKEVELEKPKTPTPPMVAAEIIPTLAEVSSMSTEDAPHVETDAVASTPNDDSSEPSKEPDSAPADDSTPEADPKPEEPADKPEAEPETPPSEDSSVSTAPDAVPETSATEDKPETLEQAETDIKSEPVGPELPINVSTPSDAPAEPSTDAGEKEASEPTESKPETEIKADSADESAESTPDVSSPDSASAPAVASIDTSTSSSQPEESSHSEDSDATSSSVTPDSSEVSSESTSTNEPVPAPEEKHEDKSVDGISGSSSTIPAPVVAPPVTDTVAEAAPASDSTSPVSTPPSDPLPPTPTPIADTPPVVADPNAPMSGKPPLTPVTRPKPKNIGPIQIITAALVVLVIAALVFLFFIQPKLTNHSTVLGASTFVPPVPANQVSRPMTSGPAAADGRDAQRKIILAQYLASYKAAAPSGLYPLNPPAVTVSVTDPTTGQPFTVSTLAPTTVGQIQYVSGGSCTGVAITPGRNGSRHLSLSLRLDDGQTTYCIDAL